MLFVRCHALVCALPAIRIHRMLLAEELRAERGIVRSGSASYVAWDLGERLQTKPLGVAWVLFDVPGEGGVRAPIALRTGPCLAVRPISKVVPLPARLFAAREGAVTGAVASDDATGPGFGLVLDIDRLWSPRELVLSANLAAGGASEVV
jgi:hypothetical protein